MTLYIPTVDVNFWFSLSSWRKWDYRFRFRSMICFSTVCVFWFNIRICISLLDQSNVQTLLLPSSFAKLNTMSSWWGCLGVTGLVLWSILGYSFNYCSCATNSCLLWRSLSMFGIAISSPSQGCFRSTEQVETLLCDVLLMTFQSTKQTVSTSIMDFAFWACEGK